MTEAQKSDIELCLYFCPPQFRHEPIEEEIKEYLDWSERGIGKQEAKFSKNPLILGKSRRGLQMEMWEDGITDGSVPYSVLLSDPVPPRSVVDFMKKEMFRGADAGIIERYYQGVV